MPWTVLDELFAVILDRKASPTPGSYTAKLLADGDEVLKKVGEEAIEVVLAGKGQSDQRLVEESADLLYHLLVLLASAWVDARRGSGGAGKTKAIA